VTDQPRITTTPACGEECAEGHTHAGRCTARVSFTDAAEHDGPSPFLPRIRQAWANTNDSDQRFSDLGMDPDRLRRIIAGQQRPNTLDMALIAEACRTTVDWLISGKEPRLTARTAPDNPAAEGKPNADNLNSGPPNASRLDICELPHQTIAEEDDCQRRQAAGGDDQLRDRYAAAIAADDGHPWNTLCAETQGSYLDNADAVMAVRDRRMQHLTAGRATWKTKAAEIEADRDRLADAIERVRVVADKFADLDQLAAVLGFREAADCIRTALVGPADTTPPADPPACTATLRLGDTLIHCTRHTHSGAHSDRIHTWYDTAAGATPHCPADTTPDPLLRLRTWLASEAATCRRNAAAARHDETRRALDGMAAGHDVAVRAIDGLTAGKALPVSGGAVAGDATPAGQHYYLSTGCLHGEHDYCQSNTGLCGAKTPSKCKWCAARCVCPCHRGPAR
jgi:hypothetical protein